MELHIHCSDFAKTRNKAISTYLKAVSPSLTFGTPGGNRTHNGPLGGGCYIHLTTEAYNRLRRLNISQTNLRKHITHGVRVCDRDILHYEGYGCQTWLVGIAGIFNSVPSPSCACHAAYLNVLRLSYIASISASISTNLLFSLDFTMRLSSCSVDSCVSPLLSRRRMPNAASYSFLESSSSSLRVPLRKRSTAGKMRFSERLRSRCSSMLPVPLNSS